MDDKTNINAKGVFRFIDLIIVVFFISVAAVCLYLFRLDLLNTFKLQNVEPVGTVIIKKNTVQRRLGDRVIWDRLSNESPVYVGDLIRVADISAATLNIKGNSIDLEENTIIRIVLAPDGESLQILMTSGTMAVFVEEGAEKVSLNLNGEDINPEQGTVLRASMPENGQADVKVYESMDKFIAETPPRKIPEPVLLSPAANSVIRYSENFPVLNFQWTNIEEATSYFLQVSSSPDFSNPRININTSAVFASLNELGQGLWYWRVTLGLPPIYNSGTVASNASFFRIEKNIAEAGEFVQNENISDWLAEEAPSTRAPSDVPVEILMGNFFMAETAPVVQTLPPETPPPAPARTPPPPAFLPVPRNIQPAQRTTYGYSQLQSQRTIVFRWSAVRGANAYIFTLYQQTANGRLQIIRSTISNGTRYTLENLSLLDRGTFIWQVEAVRLGRRGVIEQRGRTEDNILIMNFPVPGPVEIEDTGILYGN